MRKKSEYIKKLHENLSVVAINSQRFRFVINTIHKDHNLLPNHVAMYLGATKPLSEAEDVILFVIGEAVYKLIQNKKGEVSFPFAINLSDYFSEKEIIQYTNWKYETPEEDSVYPIVFNITKIATDQWISVVDVNFLRTLYNKQIINYNRNTQRNLTIKTVNGVDTYHISIVRSSINEIKEQMKQGTFIPNAISLNLNLDNSEVDFVVNKNKLYLNAGQLDIIDGYHRFRAMMELKSEDPEFNYLTIVNLMNFDESKASAFIAQEDKRNKIRKTYVKSLDANSALYFVIRRLNTSPDSAVRGMIGKYGFPIVQEQLFALVETFYIINNRTEATEVSNKLMENLNYYFEKKGHVPDFRSLCILVKVSSLDLAVEEVYKKTVEYEKQKDFLNMAVIKRGSLTSRVKNALNTIE